MDPKALKAALQEAVGVQAPTSDIPRRPSEERKDNKYHKIKYWDDKYAGKDEEFEWIVSWDHIKTPLLDVLGGFQQPDILYVGCGNSRLGVDLLDAGYGRPEGKFEEAPGKFVEVAPPGTGRIVNNDLSDTVIKQMQARYAYCSPPLVWEVQDCLKLDYPAESFDLVIDKGMSDCLQCNPDVTEKFEKILVMMNSVWDLLRDKGCAVVFSLHEPALRAKLTTMLMDSKPWKISHKPITIKGKPMQHFYLFEKTSTSEEKSA